MDTINDHDYVTQTEIVSNDIEQNINNSRESIFMEDENGVTNSLWQVSTLKNKKRVNVVNNDLMTKKPKQDSTQGKPTMKLQNRFEVLTEANVKTKEVTEQENTSKMHDKVEQNSSKTPPIFIPNVGDVKAMANAIESVISSSEYSYKCINQNSVKLLCQSPDAFRKVVRKLNNEKISFHTYQLKQDRAYRVVLKNMHFSTDPNDIICSLEQLGHSVRNIINARHYQTKQPLSMFYIDLEPAKNNKDVFDIQYLLHARITFEPPTVKREIVQCKRCQEYGHTRTYCRHPYKCVKCGETHDSTKCVKGRDTPAKCALCGENHPANYKGCSVYKSLTKKESPSPKEKSQVVEQDKPVLSNSKPAEKSNEPIKEKNPTNYASAVKNDNKCETNGLSDMFGQFFDRFEKLFTQQSQQIGLVINLLTTLISKLN